MAPPRGVWRRKSVGSRHRGAGFAVFLRVRSAGGALRCAEVWVAPARRGGGGVGGGSSAVAVSRERRSALLLRSGSSSRILPC